MPTNCWNIRKQDTNDNYLFAVCKYFRRRFADQRLFNIAKYFIGYLSSIYAFQNGKRLFVMALHGEVTGRFRDKK